MAKHIKDIKLKYFEVPSLVVKDRDILCSGRYQSASYNFNNSYYTAFAPDNQDGIQLYESDNSLFFMDQITFEQIDLPTEILSDRRPFLREGMIVQMNILKMSL